MKIFQKHPIDIKTHSNYPSTLRYLRTNILSETSVTFNPENNLEDKTIEIVKFWIKSPRALWQLTFFLYRWANQSHHVLLHFESGYSDEEEKDDPGDCGEETVDYVGVLPAPALGHERPHSGGAEVERQQPHCLLQTVVHALYGPH